MTTEYLGNGTQKITFNDGREIIITQDEILELCEGSELVNELKYEITMLKNDALIFDKIQKHNDDITNLLESVEHC